MSWNFSASIGVVLSRKRTTKALIRLCRCAGWYAPLLFAYGIKQVFSWWGSIDMCPQRTLISMWAAQSDQSLLCPGSSFDTHRVFSQDCWTHRLFWDISWDAVPQPKKFIQIHRKLQKALMQTNFIVHFLFTGYEPFSLFFYQTYVSNRGNKQGSRLNIWADKISRNKEFQKNS